MRPTIILKLCKKCVRDLAQSVAVLRRPDLEVGENSQSTSKIFTARISTITSLIKVTKA